MTNKITPKDVLNRLGKLPPREKMSEKEKEFYKEISSALMKSELEQLIANRQWIVGIISLTLMLEFIGKTMLIWKQKGSVSVRKINNYTIYKTFKQLSDLKMVDQQTSRKMHKIRKTRNNFAHGLPRPMSLSNQPNPKLEKLIQDGIAIIEELF